VLIFNGCSATPPCHSLKEAGPIPWQVQLLAPLAAFQAFLLSLGVFRVHDARQEHAYKINLFVRGVD
jgi:hypothetical protein